jgi:hypothetical protein
MRIYFKIGGAHVHCRVFTTGSKCGDLCFTLEEWNASVYTLLTRIATVTEE